jgi:hypothetical protein
MRRPITAPPPAASAWSSRRTPSSLYAIGPGADRSAKASFTRRKGLVAEESLVFAGSGLATLRYSLRGDGTLDAQWVAADGGSHLEAVLRRLP